MFIPGNHDPIEIFETKDSQELIHRANIHKRSLKLADGLVICGLGGSVQNFIQVDGKGPLNTCWNPFPYKEENHSKFNEDLKQLWDKTVTDSEDQIVIMTHEGPFLSSTAKNEQFYNGNTTYFCGSPALKDLMLANHEKIVCNIHGHTHDGSNY